jgi:hypothetical protein
MRRCGALLLLALAACGKRVELSYPAAEVRGLVLSSRTGSIVAETDADAATVRILVEGAKDRDALRIERRNGTLRIANPRDEEGSALSFALSAPEGLALTGALREGDITVTGAWGELTLRSGKGRIEVNASRVEGGTLTTERGELEFSAAEPPTRNLSCRVDAGRLSMEISPRFRGSVNLRSEVGQIDVVEDARLRLRSDLSSTAVSGFLGDPLTDDERREMAQGKRPGFPPGIWAHAKEGRVRFRLLD